MEDEYNLTIKEKGFIDDYLFSDDPKLRGNGTQCALKHFDIKNKDENVAGVLSYRMLRKDKIIAYKEAKLAEIAAEIDEKWIINEMLRLYRVSFNEGNLANAKATLELFGKYKTMFTDRTENVNITSAEDFISKAVETRKPTANNDKLTKPDNDNKTHSQPEDAKLLKNNNLQGKS